ncbi:MAG: hypothetical protein J3K34DRAFT_457897 [Monoraphidium minutum]|nr:MAG: hypothetical protein J3K34DRAFT_457897 [Monoraphidium minutum]
MLSERRNLINAKVNRHAGADAWPAAGTWMVGFGQRFGTSFSMELALRTDTPFEVATPAAGAPRALHPAGAGGALRDLLATACVNGESVLRLVGSGETLSFAGGCKVFFPIATHANDATDGALAVVTTPDLEVTYYAESEDTWHLDLRVGLTVANKVQRMHGLLGQTLHWDEATPAAVEGGDDLRYAVQGGDLLSADFAYSQFGKAASPAAKLRRALSSGAAPAAAARGLAAGTPGGLRAAHA